MIFPLGRGRALLGHPVGLQDGLQEGRGGEFHGPQRVSLFMASLEFTNFFQGPP